MVRVYDVSGRLEGMLVDRLGVDVSRCAGMVNKARVIAGSKNSALAIALEAAGKRLQAEYEGVAVIELKWVRVSCVRLGESEARAWVGQGILNL